MAWPSLLKDPRPPPRLGRAAERSRLSAPLWSLLTYGTLVAVSFAIGAAVGHVPLWRTPWLPTAGIEASLASLLLGLAVAALTLLATRALARVRWARALGDELHPLARGLGDGSLLVMAVASGVGEEIFFRGLLSPWLGIVLSSLAFGAVHQVRGPARVGWMASAALLGLAFALVFGATGSLVGPIVGHAVVNAWNLRGLRRSPEAKAPKLGGLLRRG